MSYELRYHLNAQDEICSVNEEWSSFALSNGGQFLLPPQIHGRSLWDFIVNRETEHIYRLLHGRVRETGTSARLSFRCDAPARRRLLELEISRGDDNGLTYRVRTLKEEDRRPVLLLEPGSPRCQTFVTMCSWCKRVATSPEEWLEVEEAVAALSFFEEPLPPQLTHGICEDCLSDLHGRLEGKATGAINARR